MAILEDKAVEALVKLGFKEYQAKAYCALVTLGQASATEVHKVSGVPRPRVYDTLEELVKIGAVDFRGGRPVVYKAVDPSVVVEWSRKTYMYAGDEALRQLEKMSVQRREMGFELVWVLKGEENIMGKVKQMISEARKEIFIRFFDPGMYSNFLISLEEAKARKVTLKSIVFKQEEQPMRKVEDLHKLIEFRRIDLAAEDKTGLISLMREFLVHASSKGGRGIGIIVTDMMRSMLILRDKSGYTVALWIVEPMIPMIQRTLFQYIWQNSSRIE